MTVLESLRAKISAANEAYWRHSKPIISDPEYDKLVENLRKLSPNDPLLTYVGNDAIPGAKVRHVEHMYSIGKCYTHQAVLDWMTKVSRSEDELIDCQIKLDGLSGEYVNGRLITRGDGDVGTDISHLIPNMDVRMDLRDGIQAGLSTINSSEDWKNRRIVGEILITSDRFKKFKELRPACAAYKSPRNMASGFCNLKPDQAATVKDPLGNPLKVMTFVYHDAHSITVPLKELRVRIGAIIDKLRNYSNYKGLPTDGIVFKLHDREYVKTLGATSHHLNGFCAFKFGEEEADVVVKRIVWQVGENHVTPVCEFDPVMLDDAMINRVTAHGKDFFVANNICVGSTLTIIRQGGVIPKIINVLTPAGMKCELPTVCPDCGKPLREEGAFLSCTNDECSSRIACKIVRGLNILGLKGVGPALALKVIGEMYIPDIMTWAEEISELRVSPELWNEKWLKRQTKFTASELATLMKLPELMQTGVTASTLLKSVCIPEVGDMFVNAVNKYAGGVVKLMQVVPVDRMYDYLVDRPNVNGDALQNFMVWQELHHEEFVNYMNLFNIIPEDTQSDGIADAEGCVCFTKEWIKPDGTKVPRSECIKLAKSMGFTATENANLCSVLVCADVNGNSSKLRKAKAKNKLILTYDKFFEHVRGE